MNYKIEKDYRARFCFGDFFLIINMVLIYSFYITDIMSTLIATILVLVCAVGAIPRGKTIQWKPDV